MPRVSYGRVLPMTLVDRQAHRALAAAVSRAHRRRVGTVAARYGAAAATGPPRCSSAGMTRAGRLVDLGGDTTTIRVSAMGTRSSGTSTMRVKRLAWSPWSLASISRDNGAPSAGPGRAPWPPQQGNPASMPSPRLASKPRRRTRPRRQERGRSPRRRRGRENSRRKGNEPRGLQWA
jgi:hypothetical protein